MDVDELKAHHAKGKFPITLFDSLNKGWRKYCLYDQLKC
jgi:hypothetical protein